MLILAVILGLGLQNQPFFVKTYHKLVGIFVTIIKYGNKLLENKKCDPSFFWLQQLSYQIFFLGKIKLILEVQRKATTAVRGVLTSLTSPPVLEDLS